jgi:hypothetical protein
MIMFLENVIKQNTRKPVFGNPQGHRNVNMPTEWQPANEEYKPLLIQWIGVKQMIFEILDHRVKHAEEIDGTINTTYMSLDEHLIIFMLEKHKSRSLAEKALVDFLSSLKYYANSWPRAKLYVQLLGFCRTEDSFISSRKSFTSDTRLPERMNDGR